MELDGRRAVVRDGARVVGVGGLEEERGGAAVAHRIRRLVVGAVDRGGGRGSSSFYRIALSTGDP